MINTTHIGIAAGILTAASLIPQLVKIIREKKAEEISYWMLGVLFTGVGLWICYGILINDKPIIYTNMVDETVNILIIYFKLKYRNTSRFNRSVFEDTYRDNQ